MTGKIIIHGMMTSQNFGDILLAEIVTGWLRELTTAELLSAYAAPDVQAILGTRNATPGDYVSANGVVLSGGGYFQMMDSGYPALKRFLKNTGPLQLAQLFGKPTALIGVGVDRLPHASMRFMLRRLLNHAVAAGLRDPNSLACAEELGLRRHAELTNDLVFSLDATTLDPQKQAAAAARRERLGSDRLVGLHLSGTSTSAPDYARLHERLRLALADAPPSTGYLIIEDHPSKEKGGQSDAQQEILSYLPAGRAEIVRYDGTRSMLALLHSLDSVFTNKLHVGLAAAAMGTMPFSLAKNRKNLASFDALGIGGNCLMLSAATGDMDRILASAITHSGRFTVPPDVRALSMKNRDLLKKFVAAALPSARGVQH